MRRNRQYDHDEGGFFIGIVFVCVLIVGVLLTGCDEPGRTGAESPDLSVPATPVYASSETPPEYPPNGYPDMTALDAPTGPQDPPVSVDMSPDDSTPDAGSTPPDDAGALPEPTRGPCRPNPGKSKAKGHAKQAHWLNGCE